MRAAALRGDLKQGLYFTGRGALPFGSQIRSVRELVARLLGADERAAPDESARTACLANA